MGPNDGKSLRELTKCLARALMSTSPIPFSVGLTHSIRFFQYVESKHGSLANKWVESINILTGEKWHFYIDSDNLCTESCKKLPEGAEVAATFSADIDLSQGGIVIAAFRKAVTILESKGQNTLEFCVWQFLDKEIETQAIETPNAKKDGIGIVTELWQEEIRNFRESLGACEPNYNNLRIADFRRALNDTLGHYQFDRLAQAGLISGCLNSFFRELKNKRRRYCVDGVLFGSILTVMDVFIHCTDGVQEKSADEDRVLSPFIALSGVFKNLSLPLLVGDQGTAEPARILNDAVFLAIQAGFAEKLLEIAYDYKNKVECSIEAALDSETIDESLDILYEAIPFAIGAEVILSNVSSYAKQLSDSEALQAKRSFSMVEETLARLTSDSFVSQVIDLLTEGAEWRGDKKRVLKVKREQGEEAAERFASMFFVEGNLVYPRVLIPKLLNDDQDVEKTKTRSNQ